MARISWNDAAARCCGFLNIDMLMWLSE